MYTINTCLVSLRNKVFKLLPMREAQDRGDDNHLNEYLDNLYANYTGALSCYPELAEVREIIEARNNIAFLKNTQEIEFAKWRSMVLNSTKLIQAVLLKYEGV